MARLEEIMLRVRLRAQAMREFARVWGAEPFFGVDSRGHPIAVTRELNPARPEGRWRVTWFFPEDGRLEPGGHAETGSFREALRVAVSDYGLLLETAEHLRSARRRSERDHAGRRRSGRRAC